MLCLFYCPQLADLFGCSAVPPEEGSGAAVDNDGDTDGVHEGDHGKAVLVRRKR